MILFFITLTMIETRCIKVIRSFVFLIILILISACDAPRDNPFDPDASNYYDGISTTITVHHLYPPFNPVSNVNLTEPFQQLYGLTNPEGEISWKHNPVDTLFVAVSSPVYFEKNYKFSPRSTQNSFDIYLNAKPEIADLKLNSTYENFDQQTYIFFETTLTDADGFADILLAKLMLNDYPFVFNLIRNNTNLNLYTTGDYLEIGTISSDLTNESLTELNFYLIVKNTTGDSIISPYFSIRRVIETEIELKTPVQGTSLRDSVVFTWDAVQLDYDFTYQISLQRYQEPPVEFGSIPRDKQRYVIKDLSAGRYTTQIKIIDNFGNICGSALRSFDYAE